MSRQSRPRKRHLRGNEHDESHSSSVEVWPSSKEVVVQAAGYSEGLRSHFTGPKRLVNGLIVIARLPLTISTYGVRIAPILSKQGANHSGVDLLPSSTRLDVMRGIS